MSTFQERPRGEDQTVLNQLSAALYQELHRIAARHRRAERDEHTLQTTALVHEAYLKLSAHPQQQFVDRVHFLAVASRVMRQVLVDYARARVTHKRGGDKLDKRQGTEGKPELRVDVGKGLGIVELLDLDRALDALTQEDEPVARIIEMTYFGGMTAEEAAEVLGRSVHSVRHELRFAQAWLRHRLRIKAEHAGGDV